MKVREGEKPSQAFPKKPKNMLRQSVLKARHHINPTPSEARCGAASGRQSGVQEARYSTLLRHVVVCPRHTITSEHPQTPYCAAQCYLPTVGEPFRVVGVNKVTCP